MFKTDTLHSKCPSKSVVRCVMPRRLFLSLHIDGDPKSFYLFHIFDIRSGILLHLSHITKFIYFFSDIDKKLSDV